SIGSLSDDVKALNIDGVKATSENVKNGTYKAFRPFNIAFKSEVSEVAQDFIEFILSAEGQEIVSQSYVAVNDSAESYSGNKPQGKVVVAGSSSVTPVMEKLKEAYVVFNPNAEIEIQMSDSTAGVTGAIEGTCDIGMASRSLKDSEKEQLTGIEIAYDGIAVIVNPENVIDDMTSEQVKAIFTGEMTAWNELAE
ncbi:MAG: substrate-binding domain-containing protein, partial [Clostridia bacterium]|nr:substrate-binding domain-containing protein [Clostridia bacterium]